jgi:flagellar hook-basal body complex protein FliE
MIGPIPPISSPVLPDAISPAGASSGSGAFADAFTAAIGGVEASGQQATASVERFLSGEGEELHTAIMATQRAELAFEMFVQARNKVVSAYQEIMRMPI